MSVVKVVFPSEASTSVEIEPDTYRCTPEDAIVVYVAYGGLLTVNDEIVTRLPHMIRAVDRVGVVSHP